MKLKEIILTTFLVIITTFLVTFMTFTQNTTSSATALYQVYLDGNKIAVIDDKNKLYNLINDQQQDIKDKYEVNKVYPPTGLEVQTVLTYNEKVEDEEKVYDLIKDKDPFTISGYQVTIKSDDEGSKPVVLNVLSESDFKDALTKVAEVFVGNDKYQKYINNNQAEITDVGEQIESMYFEESITVKKTFLDTKEQIFTNADDITRYLLYGSLKESSTHTVAVGESIEKIAYDNKLNTEEFLIANPSVVSADSLLSVGQIVNVNLINPLIKFTVEKHVVEDQESDFETETQYDNTKRSSYSVVSQEGVKGLNRITEKVKVTNGENQNVVISNTTELKAPVKEIVVKGGKKNNYNGNSDGGYGISSSGIAIGSGSWAWPTASPYVISSPYGYRWGKVHEAIDIAGAGYGSPIYAANYGTVVKSGWDNTGGGKVIIIDHGNGIFTLYAHQSTLYAKEGQTVDKGSVIGAMGQTGFATGTHLHFGAFYGMPYQGGRSFNPYQLYR